MILNPTVTHSMQTMFALMTLKVALANSIHLNKKKKRNNYFERE